MSTNLDATAKLDVSKYLERIGFSGPIVHDYETLAALHKNHFYNIPFDNLDIMANIETSLEIGDIYDKVVNRKRGGMCFELNKLFAWVLRELGFEVQDYLARFHVYDENVVPMRRHRIFGVKIGGDWFLCDIGVGIALPLEPIKLEHGAMVVQGGDSFKLEAHDDFGYMLYDLYNGEWRELISFTRDRVYEIDFVQPCFFTEAHKLSKLNKKNMVAIKTPTGRRTLDGTTFKIFDGPNVTTFDAADKVEFDKLLFEFFGIRL